MQLTITRARDLLIDAGLSVGVSGPEELTIDGHGVNVKLRSRPTPSDLEREHERLARRSPEGTLAYVVSRASPGLLTAARRLPDVYLLAVDDRIFVTAGAVHRLADDPVRPLPPPSSRRPWGRFAVMRALIQRPGTQRQTDLASVAGISQAAVSKALRVLGPVAEEARDGSRHAVEALWDEFLDTYPGPQGVATSWYSLDPVTRTSSRVLARHPGVVISGDAGADELAPWRVGRSVVIYATTGLELADLGFVESAATQANLTVTVPADHTLFATARAWNAGRPDRAPTADPALVAWDVRRIGGPDADEAIDRLKARVLGGTL